MTKYDLTKDAQRYEEIISINPNNYDLTEDAEKFMDRFNIAVKTASYQELKLIGRLDIIQKVKSDQYFEKDITFIETNLNENTAASLKKYTHETEKQTGAARRQPTSGVADKRIEWSCGQRRVLVEHFIEKSAKNLSQRACRQSVQLPLYWVCTLTRTVTKTNLYTLFADAKQRGEAIRERETGAPFFWYRWKEYVNRHDPKDIISREDYLKLPNEEKVSIKVSVTGKYRLCSILTRQPCHSLTETGMSKRWNAMAGMKTANILKMKRASCVLR